VGLLDDDRTEEFRSCLTSCATLPESAVQLRPFVAVASREGVLINLHLGEAKIFHIWEKTEKGYRLVETRKAPSQGGGLKRWYQLAGILADCRAVLSSGAGQTPCDVLGKSGVMPVEAAGLIEEGLQAVYENRTTSLLKGRKSPCATGSCSGSGGGCL
jgi:nitrogen fixation protein NifB